MQLIRIGIWTFLYLIARLIPRGEDAIVVLMYHSISHDPSLHTVSPEAFRVQMRMLAGFGTVVPFADVVAHVKGEKVLRRAVAVTFDDGYRDFLTEAMPVLREYGIPATIFVSGGDVDRKELGRELPLLSFDEMSQLRTPLVDIGSHAISHRKLTRLSESEAKAEISTSRQILAQRTGFEPRYFAYPKGSNSEAIRGMVARAGYDAACVAQGGSVHVGADVFAIPRVQIDEQTNTLLFRAKLTKAVNWYYTLWKLF